jgi:uncharacterized protein
MTEFDQSVAAAAAEIEETLPPFRPTAGRAGAARGRWVGTLAAWAAVVAATYLAAGSHLNPYLSLTGLFVGFAVGLTGMGGGALMTPILIFFFGFSPTMAIGTDVTYAAVTKIFGSWRHWRQGSVDVPLALWLAAGSVPASLVGVEAVNYLKHNYGDILDGILYRAVGSALMAVGVLLIVKVIMHTDRKHRRENLSLTVRTKMLTVLLGAATGLIIGLTSVGSGTFLGVFLILFYPLANDRIVGTDICHAMILLLATGVAQISVGNVNLWMVGALLLGSIPGVLIGSHLTLRTPNRLLRTILAVVLFVSGLALLGKA